MWLDNLIELKKEAGKSCKQIAEGTFLPERTVTRIFHRDITPDGARHLGNHKPCSTEEIEAERNR